MATQVWYDVEHFIVTQMWPGVTAHCPGPWWGTNHESFISDGGRHAVYVVADAGEAVVETTEDDNIWVGQWIWPPRQLVKNTPVPRPLPPHPGLGVPLPNCDGFSFTQTPGNAWVVGINPVGEPDDYDLVIFDDYVNSTTGFSSFIGGSDAMARHTDFVVGHYFASPPTVYPAILRYDAPEGNEVFIDATDAGGRNAFGTASFPYQFMDFGRVADVYEAYLEAGTLYWFTLEIHAGFKDTKLAVFPGTDGGVYSRFEAEAYGWPVGDRQSDLHFEPTVTGWHPVVVYRSGSANLDPIEYSLQWRPLEPTAVPDEDPTPAALALLAPSPNPISASTRLTFDLPHDADVRIDVFDVRGRRVTNLADAPYSAGRHEVRWLGRDRHGARVATGLYYARMVVEDRTFVHRLTVLN
jgi:hypothetical protein